MYEKRREEKQRILQKKVPKYHYIEEGDPIVAENGPQCSIKIIEKRTDTKT
jgi:hypothetical protein